MYAITDTSFRAVADATDLMEGERMVAEVPDSVLLEVGGVLPRPITPNTPAHYRAIRDAAWQWMAAEVQGRRYDTVESCCSYANSTVPRYKAEALAMIAWRDAVNMALEALVAHPPAGLETWEQVRALLPQPEQFAWPAEVDIPLGGGESAQLG